MEEWKVICDFPNYMVSNMGNVYSIKHKKVMSLKDNSCGYLTLSLYKDRKSTHQYVHRLVAEAFIPNPENKPCIDHLNCVRSDNRVENLRWATYKENCNNPKTIEKYKQWVGGKNGNSKSVIQYTKNGELVRKWDCITDVKKELGICGSHIGKCCKRLRKSAGGYKWEYYDHETYLIGLMNKNFKLLRDAS